MSKRKNVPLPQVKAILGLGCREMHEVVSKNKALLEEIVSVKMAYALEIGRFITVPLKRASDIDLAKPIETFARNTFDTVDDDLKKHIKEFNSLRRSAVGKTQDRSSTSLNLLLQYYDQFSALNRKVPFRESGGVNVSFAWKDAFDKGSLFSGASKLALPSGQYELLCVIFNIAALKSQIAIDSNLSTDDGIKTAATLFVEAAGMFQYIKEHIMSVTNQNPTQDITPEVLGAFKAIMVAQAQECFYEKANTGKMKPDILAKIANQSATLYSEASRAAGETSGVLPKEINSALSLRHDKFVCLAQFHQAGVAHNAKKFGEEIARLKKVEPMLKSLSKGIELLPGFAVKDFSAKVTTQLQDSEKENNFIYHDTIPKDSALQPIGKAVIAKPKPFNATEVLSSKFNDAFVSMVPLTVHAALQYYENRRKEIVEREVGRLREATTLINGVMSSLNLPAALEDASGGDQLPPSILEKSKAVLEKGGVQAIDGLLRDLPESLQRNEQILNEVSRMLNEEQATDDELRAKFGARWNRTPSSQLTVTLRQDVDKYSTIVQNAKKADGIVRQKFDGHREGIELLGIPADQLKSKIPSTSKVAALRNNPVVAELRKLCEQAETLKAEREVIENEIGEAKSDMTEKFSQALAAEGALNEESITVEELDRVYQPLVNQVTESIHRQESVLANIQRASEQFTVLKSQGGGGNNRDEVLKKIAAAHDGYMELMANLQEGKKFYGDLTELLIKLRNKCNDLIFARKIEKEELMKDMQQSIVTRGGPVSGPPPSYHEEANNVPPPRPPPPATTATPAQTPPARPVPAPRQGTNPAPPAAAAATAPLAAVNVAQSQPQGPPAVGGYQPPQGYAGYHSTPPYGGFQQPGYPPYAAAPPPGAPGYYQPQGGPGYPAQPQQPMGYPPGGMPPYQSQPGQYPGYPPHPGYGSYPHQQPPY